MADVVHGDRPDTGGWVPPDVVETPPIFVWPPKPLALIKWVFGFPGYLFPWNALYAGIAFLTWVYLIPEMSEMKTLEVGWIARLLVINLVSVVLFTSVFHLRLYVQRSQGIQFKYNKRWPKPGSTFLFGSQFVDNVIWTVFSGVPIWTAYLVLSLWAMANGWLPYVEWASHPIYLGLFMFFINIFREFHFYCIHRLIHLGPLYRWVHSVHHKNANPGPWSGLAMHPVEHVLYFSSVLIHWILPSNPLLIVYHLQNLAFAPAQDHCGFSKVVVNGKVQLDAATYVHYLHHRYFEVNYGGEGSIPVDKWFGTWHDGSLEAEEAMNARFLKNKQQSSA